MNELVITTKLKAAVTSAFARLGTVQRVLLACSVAAAVLLWADVRQPGPKVVVGGGEGVRSQVLARLYVGTLNSIAVPAVLAPNGKLGWRQRLAALDSGKWAVTAESASDLLAELNSRLRPEKNVFGLSGQLSSQLPEGLDISDITPNGSIAVYRIGVLTFKQSKGLGILADQLAEADLAALTEAVCHGANIDRITQRWLVEHNFNPTDKPKLEDQL